MLVRKRDILVVTLTLLLMLLAATPVMALPEPNGEKPEISVCRYDGTVKVTYTNHIEGAYFQVCTDESEPTCAELGWLDNGETGTATLPKVGQCVMLNIGYCQTVASAPGVSLLPQNGCIPNYQLLIGLCTRDNWPTCPVDTGTCEGGAGLYPPSNNGVPYNGYNDAGNFLLVVDSHCGQSVEWVDVFTGDPLTELTQVMSLWVDSNGWTQFSQDDIQNIRDMNDYSGEIWFRVHGIGDRYYGLHELMTHPNLGSGE